MHWQAEAFWQYSIETYANDGVKSCCLFLQDEWQLNVNLLLLACYLQHTGVRCQPQHFCLLKQAIVDNDQVLQAHRTKRKAAKKGDSKLYQALLDEELVLEKLQQEKLVATLNSLNLSSGIGNNLIEYAKYSEIDNQPEVLEKLHTLLALTELKRNNEK